MSKPICTKHLILYGSSLIPEDELHQMVQWLNDPEIVRYSEQRHKVHSQATQYAYINSFLWPSQFRIIRFVGKMIGTMTAFVDVHNDVADMGIMIGDKDVQRQGYGTEAWEGLMHHLFGMGIHKIEAGCMSPNIPMVRIFKKSGMHKEGYRDSHFKFKSGRADLEQWAKFK